MKLEEQFIGDAELDENDVLQMHRTIEKYGGFDNAVLAICSEYRQNFRHPSADLAYFLLMNAVLEESTLLYIIQNHHMFYRLAVARREDMPASVEQLLVADASATIRYAFENRNRIDTDWDY
jgi:hypothetical protein